MKLLKFVPTLLIAVVAGMATTLAYAPFSISVLGILCPALLLVLWQNNSPRKSALIGLFYGLGLFGTGTWWIYISVHEFGHLASPLAALAALILVTYEALFPALQGYLLSRFTASSSAIRFLVFFPCSGVLSEWIRSGFMSGWHWIILGYTQIDAPLGGYAPIVGIYGLSFLSFLTAGIFAQTGILLWGNPRFSQLWEAKLKLILVAVIWVNGALLIFYPFTEKNGKSLTVSMIQGNVPQELKWEPEALSSIVEKYHAYTRKLWGSDLIIWPEAAIPALSTVAEPFLDSLSQEAKKHNSHVLLGIPVAEGKNFYNAMIMLGPSEGHYYKRHLVPFGEYLPFKLLFTPILDALHIPMSDFTPGAEQQALLRIKDIHMAGFICYEIVEPDEVRRALLDAELIVTITDDSWFDGSIAAEQHLQMARMRCLENGLPQLFLSSRGASAIINNKGKIERYLPEHQEGVIKALVYSVHGKTPWRHWGSWPVLFISLLGVVATLIIRRR